MLVQVVGSLEVTQRCEEEEAREAGCLVVKLVGLNTLREREEAGNRRERFHACSATNNKP